jgi:hypothetical protein
VNSPEMSRQFHHGQSRVFCMPGLILEQETLFISLASASRFHLNLIRVEYHREDVCFDK